eukprot:1344140-Rhodomonas_salina.2
MEKRMKAWRKRRREGGAEKGRRGGAQEGLCVREKGGRSRNRSRNRRKEREGGWVAQGGGWCRMKEEAERERSGV